LNTLAASALLMLLFNPFSIADTGFQLSYLSVAGIIVLYPLLFRLMEFRNSFLNKIWELVCLSVSAQLAIAPLSIIYFHQFPNYFMLTNLLIVPLLIVVICSGVLFFAASFIPVISTLTALLLQKSLLLMNNIVEKMHYLPWFATRGISISAAEALVLYIFLFSLLVFAINKNKLSFFMALICLVIFTLSRAWKGYTQRNQQIFTVYNIPKHSAIAFISGRECIMTKPLDSLNFCEHIQYYWWDKGIKDTASLKQDTSAVLLSRHLCFQHNFAAFNRLQIAFIGNNEDIPECGQKVQMNYVVVSGNYKLGMEALQHAFTFDRLIFDSSVSPYRLKKWKEECEQLHIRYYDVNTQGAFIQELNI
jgi:competence protein ComEC